MVHETGPISFELEGEPLYHLFGSYTRYSSWTARAVTVLEYFRIPYHATYVPIAEVSAISPSGLVPLLTPLTGPLKGTQLNDSLSIALYLAEAHPEKNLFPQDVKLRALARSAALEMHSGFSGVRNAFDTNFVGIYTGNVPISPKEHKEIKRLLTIFNEARRVTAERSAELGVKDEGYLFGDYSIADVWFWPVLWRFRTYNLPLKSATPATLAWIKKTWEDPILKVLGEDYFAQAKNPETVIAKYDDKWRYDDSVDAVWGSIGEDWVFDVDAGGM